MTERLCDTCLSVGETMETGVNRVTSQPGSTASTADQRPDDQEQDQAATWVDRSYDTRTSALPTLLHKDPCDFELVSILRVSDADSVDSNYKHCRDARSLSWLGQDLIFCSPGDLCRRSVAANWLTWLDDWEKTSGCGSRASGMCARTQLDI